MSRHTRPPRKPATDARQHGTAVIELAITLIFLLLLTVGITEIGRAFWYYSAIQKATREGARCLSMVAWSNDAASLSARNACRDLVVNDANSAGVQPALAAANVDVASCDYAGTCRSWGSGNPPTYVTVTIVNYQIRWLWGFGGGGPEPGQQSGMRVVTTMPYMR